MLPGKQLWKKKENRTHYCSFIFIAQHTVQVRPARITDFTALFYYLATMYSYTINIIFYFVVLLPLSVL